MVDESRYGDGYPEEADDEEEWFGEGSAFDSGEDLAAALFSMAGVAVPGSDDAAEVAHEPSFEAAPVAHQARPAPGPGKGASVSVGAETYQIIERAGAEPAAPQAPAASPTWSVRPQVPGTGKTGWGMRHSVQFLKMTEEVMKKLRNEAIDLTWQVSGLAVQQGRNARR